MAERVITYVLRFRRNQELLDAQIHRTLEEASDAAFNLAACYGQNLACSQLEQLLLVWDPEHETALTWSDGEYALTIDVYVSRHPARENNRCRVIPFRRVA